MNHDDDIPEDTPEAPIMNDADESAPMELERTHFEDDVPEVVPEAAPEPAAHPAAVADPVIESDGAPQTSEGIDDVGAYVMNFRWVVGLLIGLTVLNVILGTLGVHVAAIAMVAALQVSMVFVLLMHAMADMKVLTPLFSLCGVFVVLLICLMLVAHTDTIEGTEHIQTPAATEHDAEADE